MASAFGVGVGVCGLPVPCMLLAGRLVGVPGGTPGLPMLGGLQFGFSVGEAHHCHPGVLSYATS
eukprot:scaffold83083_cov19-Tisochrysis_lutea.AAC.1